MNWEYKAVIIILAFLMVFSFGYRYHDTQDPPNEVWACMDGCYNMILVEHGRPAYNDTYLRAMHKFCSDSCFEVYMPLQ